MSDEKVAHSGPDPLAAVAGPHTTIDKEEADKGMPHVGAPGLGYALPARNDGMIYARPFRCTSVNSVNQHVSGYVDFEPEDRIPNPSLPGTAIPVGPYSMFVRDIPMGNPSQPNTVHWLAANYMGRSDGPGLTPDAPPEVVHPENLDPSAFKGVPGNFQPSPPQPAPMPDSAPPAGHEPDPADRNKDGVVSEAEQRRFDKRHPHEKP